jgi:hypothetical protein
MINLLDKSGEWYSQLRLFQLLTHEEISFSGEEKKTLPVGNDVTDDGNISVIVPTYVFNVRQTS